MKTVEQTLIAITAGLLALFVIVLLPSCVQNRAELVVGLKQLHGWASKPYEGSIETLQLRQTEKESDAKFEMMVGPTKEELPETEDNSGAIPATLVDDPSQGELYLWESCESSVHDTTVRLREPGTGMIHFMPVHGLITTVGLSRVHESKKGDPQEDMPAQLVFEDSDGLDNGKMSLKVKDSVWFRVAPGRTKGAYVIRGYDRIGKCIYYKEWNETMSVMSLKEADKNSASKVGVSTPQGSSKKINVPQFILPKDDFWQGFPLKKE